MLEGWLDYHRQTLLGKCAGLTEDQLKESSAPPSNLTLLGLVRHMADVERAWFRRRLAGQDVPFLYIVDGDHNSNFSRVASADAESDFAVYAREVEAARKTAAGYGLDETFFYESLGESISVRWVYTHMIEEYARHNGHADLLRERIDGATGQ
ncbi:MAG: DinB family protein [Nocardiopsaceae bacterium]|nr:DinB family protein [Nocardiopsaceae bacterium]